MIGIAEVLWGGVAPGVVAAVTLLAIWRLSGKAASAWRTALVAGYLAGHWALDASNISQANNFGNAESSGSIFSLDIVAALAKSYQPTEAHHWIPLLVSLAILPDAIACFGKLGPVVGWLLRIALCLFVPWRLFRGSAYLPLIPLPNFGFETLDWSQAEAFAWISGIGAIFLLLWFAIRASNEQDNLAVRSLLPAVVALGAAITTALSGSFFYGQLLGVLTGALAGAGVAAGLLKIGRDPEAAAGPLVIVYGSLIVLASFFAELSLLHAVILLFAMVAAVGWLPRMGLSLHKRTIVRVAICLGMLTAVVAHAGFDFSAAQAETETDPYGSYQP